MRYSQNDEEDVILKHFEDKNDGRLLDLGAFDGSTFSNTRTLIERGWSGVLVEPSPWPFASLTRLWWSNDKVTLINAAVVAQSQAPSGLMEFLATEDAVSCLEERTAMLWGREKFRKVLIRSMTVDMLPLGPYDFVTIDVEDGTMPLVNDMIAKTTILHDAKLVCLEHTAGGVSTRAEMAEAMNAIGKRIIHTTGENYLFV